MLLAALAFPAGFANAQSASASDIEGHWANKEISAWIEGGLISGYADGTFKPNNAITRAEFAALVNRSFKLVEKAAISFTDVNEGAWYYPEIEKAKKAGYMNGYSDGTVKPNANITREEVASIVARLTALEEDASGASDFTDSAAISQWSIGYIGAAVKAGFMKGYPDGSFKPQNTITRAESVVVLNNALGQKGGTKEEPKEEPKETKSVTIEAIKDQKVNVNATAKVTVKTVPGDAKVTVQSSDDKVATATLKGADVEVKGVKAGTATVTVTAKKDGMKDGVVTFKVTVETAAVSGGGGGGGGGGNPGGGNPPTNPPANEKPVIKVVEPDNVNDGVITLKVGDRFVAPTVTATDKEDGNITHKIVKKGENLVDTSKVGEYLLTYNVEDSQKLAADERKVTVKVVKPAPVTAKAKISVLIGNLGFVKITVHSSTVGTHFKVEESTSVEPIKENSEITLLPTKGTQIVTILDAAGRELGKITVDVSKDSTKEYTFEVQDLPNQRPVISVLEPDNTHDGIITLKVGDQFVAPTVTANDFEDGNITNRIVKTGEDQVDTSKVGEYVLTYNVKDSQNLAAVERKVTVKVVTTTTVTATANITVQVGAGVDFKRIIVNSSTAGAQFKVEESTSVESIGPETSITVLPTKDTQIVTILDAAGKELGTITVDVAQGSTKDYTFEAQNPTAKITVQAGTGVDFKRITVNNSTVGVKFKVEESTSVESIGTPITVLPTKDTQIVTILDAAGKVLGTITVDVSKASTKVYTFEVQGGGNPTNQKPVITVVEPDGTDDGIITLKVGDQFVAPTVTANDPEDGTITDRIVKTGEAQVDTSKVGEYVLTYNVKDSKNLAAVERKVTVKVMATTPNTATANIKVEVALGIKRIAVISSTVGVKFKVQDIPDVKEFGENDDNFIYIAPGATERIVSILDAAGKVIGTITVDISKASTKDYTFEVQK